MTKKVKNNIFKEKEFIIGLIILIILVLTPEIISKYNSYTSIKVNEITYEYYKMTADIYNDSKTRINNICLIDKSKDYKTYSLNKKYTKHEKIYNNLLSLHKTLNKENFKSVNIKRLNTKQEMLNNYNQKLKYEINELQFQNDTIKYFEQILNN